MMPVILMVHAQFVLMKLRKEFHLEIILIKENFATMNNSEKVQFLFSLSETEKGTICQFSKFVCQSFKVRESHM